MPGRMIILAWFTDPKTGTSSGSLILGVEDGSSLERLHQRVKAAAV